MLNNMHGTRFLEAKAHRFVLFNDKEARKRILTPQKRGPLATGALFNG